MPRLQIYNARERRLVATADAALAAFAALMRPIRRRVRPRSPRRILLLRLERIGDLLMTLPAIADVRALAPHAEVDLVVGSWNANLGAAIHRVNRVEALDAAWLARGAGGRPVRQLLQRAKEWRRQTYDLAINFEPDIRSNLLLAASGASWTVGYRSGGGGALLDRALDFDPRTHTTDNARRLVSAAFERPSSASAAMGSAVTEGVGHLRIPEAIGARAAARVASARGHRLVGVHVSGGRAIKQWEPVRFAEVARRLAIDCGATILLTGEPRDRPLVDVVTTRLPEGQVIDTVGDVDLLELAALLQQLDLLVTGDTGPMHLAAAVGTPTVSIFGPSDPARYAPPGPHHTVVRVDLPCSPCNRIRLPPTRCVGHTPDCLALVSAERVVEAAKVALSRNR